MRRDDASTVALLAGVGGLLVVGDGLRADAHEAGFAYLLAFAYFASIALGCLALAMVGHVTGARWFMPLRRPVEALAATIPVYALLFVPIAFAMPSIYPWVSSPGASGKAAYLNAPF